MMISDICTFTNKFGSWTIRGESGVEMSGGDALNLKPQLLG